MPDKAQWTVLTYIAAHNNLDSFGRKSSKSFKLLLPLSTSDLQQSYGMRDVLAELFSAQAEEIANAFIAAG